MTREAVVRVVQRAISDGAFRTQLTKDAATALRGFDLTPAEAAALRSGDSGKISALGVDLRMSKVFALASVDGSRDGVLTTGADSSLSSGVNSVNSTMTSGVDSSGASTVNSSLTAGASAGADAKFHFDSLTSGADSSLQSGTDSSVNSSATIDQGAIGNADATIGENAGHQVVQWDGNDDAPLSTLVPGEPAHAFGAQTPDGSVFGGASLTAGDEGYLPSVNYASTSEGGANTDSASAGFATDEGQLTNGLNADAGLGGAASPTEGDGPNITP